jgi:hypothetical protein|tara:strand:+ start:115 stop:381 length:267 start_codon:yes stop_codon:yes gene_type:complete
MSVDRDLLIKNMRKTRDEKLASSDIDMIRTMEDAASFAAFSTARAAWLAYREALRDLPSTVPDIIEDDYSNVPAMPLSPPQTAALSED